MLCNCLLRAVMSASQKYASHTVTVLLLLLLLLLLWLYKFK